MSRNAPKCILGVVVVAVFFALTWSTTAARLSITNTSTAVKPKTAVAPRSVNLTSVRGAALTATVSTNYADYQPGDIVVITGSGWQPGETVTLKIDESDGDAPWNSSAVADGSGNIYNNEFVIQTHDRGVSFTLTATGATSGQTATATFTDNVTVDFKQSANNDAGFGLGNIHWIGSIVQGSNSTYFEGMSNFQRTVFTDVASTPSNIHRLTFNHEFTKGGVHAYDFLTSYAQALQDDAQALGVAITLNPCGVEIGPPASLAGTCSTLRAGSNFVDVDVPDDPYISKDGSTLNRITAYETSGTPVHGNRTIRIYGDAPIGAASLTLCHDVAAGADTGDSSVHYVLTWTSTSTQLLVEMAGHLAVSGDGTGLSWGPGLGSSGISGGPYHFRLDELGGRIDDATVCPPKLLKADISSLGAQDNQIKGADILVQCPTCDVSGPTDPVCPGSTNNVHTVTVNGTCTSPSINWTITGNGTIVGSTTGTSVTVTAGSTCNASYTVTAHVTCSLCPETTCSDTVLVNDTTAPSISCPANVTVQCDSDVPAANTGLVTASDNCGTATKTFEGDSPSGTCPKVITRTYKATDGCGNTATCTQTITVNDTTPPSISCPANVTVQCDADVPAANTGLVTASDNCGTATKTFEGDSPSGSCPKVITRTYKATDGCGNTATCTQTITVNDTTPPSISCPANVTVQCDADVPAANTASVTASDNCGTATKTFEGDSPSGSCPKVITRTYKATDGCGNTATCTQTITVNDTTPPVLGTCPPNQAFCDNGVNTFTFTAPGATDNCSGTVPVTCVRSDGLGLGVAYPVGTTGIRCSTQDTCGNRSSCGFTVTVHPKPSCEIVPPSSNPICGTTGNSLSANVSGGTPPYDLTWSVVGTGWSIENPPGNKANPISYTTGPAAGTATFTLVVLDAFGCTSTCTLDVSCSPPQVDNCTLTQGFYGNQKGKFNNIPGTQLVAMLLSGDDLTVGKPGRSLTILGGASAADSAACLVKRLPGTQTPSCLPDFGDKTLSTTTCQTTPALPLNGQKWSNVLLGQVVTLSLNLRLDTKINEPGHVALADRQICNTFVTQGALPGPDGLLGTNDDTINPADPPQTFSIPFSVTCALTHLGLPHTVGGLLELGNRALACQCIDVATIGDVNLAIDAINRGYDQCRFLLTGSCVDSPASCPAPADCTPPLAGLFNPNSDRVLARARAIEVAPFATSMKLISWFAENRSFFSTWATLFTDTEANPGYQRFTGLLRWNPPARASKNT